MFVSSNNALPKCDIIYGVRAQSPGRKEDMEETKQKLKVYCETSFWSWLVSRPSSDPDHAVKQAWTRKWWAEAAPKCEIYISEHVLAEAARGDNEQSQLRLEVLAGRQELDGSTPDIDALATALLSDSAVPKDEVTDAYHIATAAIHGMDVLLTWNCRHLANRFALPKTIAVVTKAGFQCPAIVTPENFMKEDLDE